MIWHRVDYNKWMPWYAWRPVRVEDARMIYHWAWLQMVERKRKYGFEAGILANWVYRDVGSKFMALNERRT